MTNSNRTIAVSANHGRIWNVKLGTAKDALLSSFVGPQTQRHGRIPFVYAEFNGTGEIFAACDKRAHLFLFYLARNRYVLVSKQSKGAQIIKFTDRKHEEVVTACGSTIKVYNVDSHRCTASLDSAHTHEIIAMDACGPCGWFISVSFQVCILWDMKTWSVEKSLWAEASHYVDARFIPTGGDICTSFKDFRVVIWCAATLQMRREFRVDALSEVMRKLCANQTYVAAAGSRSLMVWQHREGELKHIVNMPFPIVALEMGKIRVRTMETATALFMLYDDGQLQIVCMDTMEIRATLCTQKSILTLALGPDFSHVLSVISDGSMNLWDAKAVLEEERQDCEKRMMMGVPKDMLVKCLKSRDISQSMKAQYRMANALEYASFRPAGGNSSNIGQDAIIDRGLSAINSIITGVDALQKRSTGYKNDLERQRHPKAPTTTAPACLDSSFDADDPSMSNQRDEAQREEREEQEKREHERWAREARRKIEKQAAEGHDADLSLLQDDTEAYIERLSKAAAEKRDGDLRLIKESHLLDPAYGSSLEKVMLGLKESSSSDVLPPRTSSAAAPAPAFGSNVQQNGAQCHQAKAKDKGTSTSLFLKQENAVFAPKKRGPDKIWSEGSGMPDAKASSSKDVWAFDGGALGARGRVGVGSGRHSPPEPHAQWPAQSGVITHDFSSRIMKEKASEGEGSPSKKKRVENSTNYNNSSNFPGSKKRHALGSTNNDPVFRPRSGISHAGSDRSTGVIDNAPHPKRSQSRDDMEVSPDEDDDDNTDDEEDKAANVEDEDSTLIVPCDGKRKSGQHLPLTQEVQRDVFAPLQELYGIHNRLSVRNLRSLLLRQGHYPETHRCLIWRYLLQLPYNQTACEALERKGLHPRFTRLRAAFPHHSAKEYMRLEKLCSCLGHYSMLFAGEVEYLPQFVFPFLSLFGRDLVLTFEVVLSVLLNWCKGWFTYHPNLPTTLLGRLDDAFCKIDPVLHRHLAMLLVTDSVDSGTKPSFGETRHGSSTLGLMPQPALHTSSSSPVSSAILWPLLTSCMTEVLNRADWAQLWDHLVTHWTEPELFYAAILSFLVSFRQTLLKMRSRKALHDFLHEPQPIHQKTFLRHMYKICKEHFGEASSVLHSLNALPLSALVPSTNGCLHQSAAGESSLSVIPLPVDSYPPFTGYPRFIIDEQQVEWTRLAAMETRLVDAKSRMKEMEEVNRRMIEEEDEAREQQLELCKAAEARADYLAAEDKKLSQERKYMDAKMFHQRIEAIRNMQKTTVDTVSAQRCARIKEEERALEEITRRQKEKTYEMETRLQEEALLNLEMETHTKLFDVIQHRRREESGRALRVQIEQSTKEQELNKALQNQVWRVEDEQQRVRLTKMRQEKVNALEDAQDETQRRRILSELRIKNLETHIGLSGVARERALRKTEAEFELKHDLAAKLRRQMAELRVEADRRDQDGSIQESLNRKTNIEVGPLRKMAEEEAQKYAAEADADEAELLQQREEHMRKVFDEQLQRTEAQMEDMKEKEESNIRAFLMRMENSQHEAREEEELREMEEQQRRDQEMRALIAKHEADLAELEDAFSPKMDDEVEDGEGGWRPWEGLNRDNT